MNEYNPLEKYENENKVKIEWIQIINEGTKRTAILNLPNGCLVRHVTIWPSIATETMQFVPGINYIDGEFKQILTQQFHIGF
jgi:hypothetical protein